MKKLKLHYNPLLQGDFTIKPLNILLVFQVNCPGCFSYALPILNKLHNKFHQNNISFLGLSTAFEDFDKNTLANTEDLVKHGKLVGETKKMMLQQGIKTLPYTIDFPIAIDTMEDSLSNIEATVDSFCRANANYDSYKGLDKRMIRNRVKAYLNSLEKIALTFTLNQLQGTPSFILFNEQHEILAEWFGHVKYEEIEKKIYLHNQGK